MRLKPFLLPALIAAGTLAIETAALAAPGNFGLDAAVSGTGIPQTASLPILIGKILQTVLSFVGALFLLLTVYAGFIYMTARGDDKKVATAKQMITGAVTGIVIIGAAYALTTLVLNVATGAGNATNAPNNGSTIGTRQRGESCTSGSDCADGLICDSGQTNTCI